MIVSRTPTRVCLAGGGSDVPDFYRGGFGAVVTLALATYVYVAIHPRLDGRVGLYGLLPEDRAGTSDLVHPLVREALQEAGVLGGIDVAIFSDVPGGTGLATSSALTVGLLCALERYLNPPGAAAGAPTGAEQARACDQHIALRLAEAACRIEIDRLAGNAGKLDQYSTALGGPLYIEFHADDSVICRRLALAAATAADLQAHMMLFDTALTHQASKVMAGWRRAMTDKRTALCRMRDQALEAAALLEAGEVEQMGPLLDEAWQIKREIADGVTSPGIDAMYQAARGAGATGGKLCGAGGGGFLLVFAPPACQTGVRAALAGHRELPVRLADHGTEVILDSRGQTPAGHPA